MWMRLVLCCALQRVLSIRLVSIQIPERVPAGEGVGLSCDYDLEGDLLYNIKWYLDGVEFFRFVPSDIPPRYFFPIKGIQVDLQRSGNGTVFIQDVKTNTSGTYRCEISADAPSFQTLLAEKMMAVEEAEEIPARSCSANGRSPVLIAILLTVYLAFITNNIECSKKISSARPRRNSSCGQKNLCHKHKIVQVKGLSS